MRFFNTQTSNLYQRLSDIQAHNVLLSLGIILQIEHYSKQLGVGLIILWLSIIFLAQITQAKSTANKNAGTLYAALLGLLLIQTRAILNIEDEFGFTQYFLIALGIAAAASLTLQQQKRLLQWVGGTSVPLLILYILQHFSIHSTYLYGFNSTLTSVSQAFSNIPELRSYLQETVFSFLAISGLITGRISKSWAEKLICYSSGACGLILCLILESRMAIIAPLISLLIGIAISHTSVLKRFSAKTKIAIVSSFLASILAITYTVVIAPDMKLIPGVPLASDRGRVNVALCWANSMLAGDNRFIYGSGHSKEFIMKRCTDRKVGNFWNAAPNTNSTAGHAHNVFAHIMGLHGLLGIISLAILGCVYFKGLIYFANQERIFDYLPLSYAPWSESIITMGLFMFICSMSTTFFVYNHTLQVIIGIGLGMPLARIKGLEE